MVNFGKKLMVDQVEEWKGYDFLVQSNQLMRFVSILLSNFFFVSIVSPLTSCALSSNFVKGYRTYILC